MANPILTTTTQLLSITTALLSAGGIATLSLFDIPQLQSQPASRSLPMTRWLFSRGSHIFPTASIISTLGFASLAYTSLPVTTTSASSSYTVMQMLRYGRVPGYLLAAVLTFSIGPFTSLMVPTNFRLIEINERRGGARSAANETRAKPGGKTVEESVGGEGQVGQFRDLSGPMGKTKEETSEEEDREVRELLGKFGRLNGGRALLMGAGGMVGLWTALV